MAQIKAAHDLVQAQKVLAESETLGMDMVTIARAIHAKVKQFIALTKYAQDVEDAAVFDARIAAAIAAARDSIGPVTADEKALVSTIFSGIFPS